MTMQSNSQSRLREHIEKIEACEAERRTFAEDVKAHFEAAKSEGFDPKIMRQVIRLRKIDAHERETAEATLATYMHALGMMSDLPLGKAAIARDFGVEVKLAEGAVQ